MNTDEQSYYVHPSSILEPECMIHKGVKIWHFCHIFSGCEIGEDTSIGQNCVIFSNVKLGRNVKVQNNVSVYEGVVCEDDVFLGPSMVFTNIINPRSAIPRKDQYAKTIVRKGATIGANATIICNHEIGEYAFIGAGTVITKDVAAYALIVGNPGRQIGWVSEYGHRLAFNADGIAKCPESDQLYRLINDVVSRIEG